MINLDNIANKNNKKHNEKWPYIPDHPHRVFIIGGSGSGKTNTLFNLIKEQDYHDVIDKIYLHAKYWSEPKCECLIKKCEVAGTKHVNDPKAFIVCLNVMDDAYEDIDNYNSKRDKKVLIVFDDMIADIMINKRFQAIIKELFTRCTKLNISLVFINQSYCSVPKDVRLNSIHYLIMEINSKRESQNIAINHSADIDYNDFMKIYRERTREPYNFFTIDTTLPAGDPLRFRKNLFVSYKNYNSRSD